MCRVCLLVLVIAAALPDLADAQPCVQDTIGIDPSIADNAGGDALGESVGQTFYAADTLMTFLRVWRVENQQNNIIGMHLYITMTLPSGEPDMNGVLVDGPTLVNQFGDGVHPIEFEWQWDPPLALPHRGEYTFFLGQDPCIGYWDILTKTGTIFYPDGEFVWTPRSSDCRLSPLMQGRIRHNAQDDCVFQIGFCHDAATTQRRRTWGELKMLYR